MTLPENSPTSSWQDGDVDWSMLEGFAQSVLNHLDTVPISERSDELKAIERRTYAMISDCCFWEVRTRHSIDGY